MIRHGRNVAIYINGVDLSGDLNAINPTSVQELPDITTFGPGTVGHSFYPGLAKDTGTIEAVYDTTETNLFESLIQINPSYSMLVMFGQSIGNPAYGVEECMLKSNSIKSVVTDVNRATINFDTDNHPFEDCKILDPKTNVTTSSTAATSVDNAAASALGGAGYLQVFGVSTGTFVGSIQTSSSGAWAGEQATTCTFTAASSNESQRVAITGSIGRYARAAWTLAGGTYATFAMALKRY